MTTDYLQIYDLESYLLETVRANYHRQGFLNAFDFFCIIIWKANRAKTKIAKRLLSHEHTTDLEIAVKNLTSGLYAQTSGKERLHYLMFDWGFLLPMASAVLMVLYPEEFTVYDIRVCTYLDNFYNIGNTSKFERLWEGYDHYREAVIQATPKGLSLRDKDRFIWAKSFSDQLKSDIDKCFSRTAQNEN